MPRISEAERLILKRMVRFTFWSSYTARYITNKIYQNPLDIPHAGEFAQVLLSARDALLSFGELGNSLYYHYTKTQPIIKELTEQPGISRINALRLFALIDVYKAPSPKHIWNYVGMGIHEGKPRRRLKRGKLAYSAFAKNFVVGLSYQIIRAGGPYKKVFDEYMFYYAHHRPSWTPSHRKHAARRRMLQVFFAHLWYRWRTLEGLPIVAPKPEDGEGYAIRYNINEYWFPLGTNRAAG